MEISSISDLDRLEGQISQIMQRIDLDSILLGLREISDEDVKPFIKAGVALFAVRFSNPGSSRGPSREIKQGVLISLAGLVGKYLLTDPIVFDEKIERVFRNSNIIFPILRLVGSQFPFDVELYEEHAQALLLFEELPKKLKGQKCIPDFDFEDSFKQVTGVSVIDFVDVGFVAWYAATEREGFTRKYFDNLRSRGVKLPDDKIIEAVLRNLAADPKKMRDIFFRFRNGDKRFRMYDFNPLLMYPIIRPWRKKGEVPKRQDRMISPLPNLVAYRTTTGIFYQMFNEYKEDFSRYFGHLFQTYVGEVLKESVTSNSIFSENEIRKTYPKSSGKVPDWVIIEGNKAMLIECKATRFSRAALTTAFESDVNDSLKQVIKGFGQLHNFREACIAQTPGLEFLHKCNEFYPIIVTYEPLYLINSASFRRYIDSLLDAKDIRNLPWLVLEVKQVEALQPHLSSGISFSDVVNDLYKKDYNEVLNELRAKTNKTFEDCFLYKKYEELFQRLQKPKEDNSG